MALKGSGKRTKVQGAHLPHVRIFLSAPGDVAEEREFVRTQIKETLPCNPERSHTATVTTWRKDHQDGHPLRHCEPTQQWNPEI